MPAYHAGNRGGLATHTVSAYLTSGSCGGVDGCGWRATM
jgi:hypothetical protein